MGRDYETVVCMCQACDRVFVTSLPIDWDGSVVCCLFCCELAAEVADGR